jgi:hypothetical protein
MQLPMKVGDQYLQLNISVLEADNMEFLFGLDMLRRYRCNIDLFKNALCFPDLDVSLPFLQESQVPAKMFNRGIPEGMRGLVTVTLASCSFYIFVFLNFLDFFWGGMKTFFWP